MEPIQNIRHSARYVAIYIKCYKSETNNMNDFLYEMLNKKLNNLGSLNTKHKHEKTNKKPPTFPIHASNTSQK